MTDAFFAKPILNWPYAIPSRHWELDESGQPTQRVLEHRRPAAFVTPIPKPRKRRSGGAQAALLLDEQAALSTADQRYDPTPIYAFRLREPTCPRRGAARAARWIR